MQKVSAGRGAARSGSRKHSFFSSAFSNTQPTTVPPTLLSQIFDVLLLAQRTEKLELYESILPPTFRNLRCNLLFFHSLFVSFPLLMSSPASLHTFSFSYSHIAQKLAYVHNLSEKTSPHDFSTLYWMSYEMNLPLWTLLATIYTTQYNGKLHCMFFVKLRCFIQSSRRY